MKFHRYLYVLYLLFLSSGILIGQNQITGYEFWTNSDISNKVTVNISPTEVLVMNEYIDLQGLKPGFNNVSIRFKDSDGNYSSVYSQYIWAYSSESPITEYEYWFDGDNSAVNNIELENSETAEINAFLDASELSNGFHSVHIRFKNSGGLWSSVYSKMFFTSKSPEFSGVDIDLNEITHYRYWFDVATEPVVVTLEPEETFQANFSIDIPDLAESFYIQFRDISGLWSGVYHRPFTPIADFDIYSVINTFTMQNRSTFSTKFYWDFDDGTKSEGVHPSHTYDTPGVYDICLIAENKLGFDTLCKTVQVSGIREVVSNQAGNRGYATIMIYGGGLKDGSKVWLEKDGENYLNATDVRLARLDALEARLDLYDKELGTYDVVVELPDKTTYRLDQSFEIVQATDAQPYVSFNGRNRILFGRWQTYTIDFGNTGNTDALGVPLYFMLTMPDGLEYEFNNLNIVFSEKWKDNEYYDEIAAEPAYIEQEGYWGGDEKIRLYAFYIPVIPAGSKGQVQIRIKTNASFKAYTWLNEPMFEYEPEGIVKAKDDKILKAINKKTAACLRALMLQAMKDGVAEIANEMIPGVGCANSILNLTMDPAGYLSPDPTNPEYNRPKSWKETFWDWGGKVKDVTLVIAGCAADVVPAAKAYKTAVAVIGLISKVNDIYGAMSAGNECYKKYGDGELNVSAVSSFDPNEIVGPSGYKNENYLNKENFSYTIFFENKASATAPAQEVVILDTLAAGKYDLESFTFGSFSFGGDYYNPLPGLKEFTLDIPLENGNTNIVRVNANFDAQTRVAYWQFITLDPETMQLTEDPDGGFLPPNNVSPEGEGSVSFNIQLLDGLPNNEAVNAKAKIFFDLNEPIETNEYLNTLDLEPPTSTMTGVFTTWEENLLRIEWEGDDTQSGVRYYTIYMAVDDDEYDAWFTSESTLFYFEADPDSVYKFFCIATDSTGNTEPMKSSYEASTETLSIGDIALSGLNDIVDIYPNPATNTINVEYTTFNSGKILITFVNAYGEEIFKQELSCFNETNKYTIDSSELPTGVYFINLKGGNRTITRKVVVVK